MIAKMKCSNCGAEMSNLNMNWGKRQWLFTLPIMLLGFYPMMQMFFFKGDATKELTISNVQTRKEGRGLVVTGLMTNTGTRDWSSVTLKAEFFDAAGNFLEAEEEMLMSGVGGNGKEHFNINVRSPSEAAEAPTTKIVVRVMQGHRRLF